MQYQTHIKINEIKHNEIQAYLSEQLTDNELYGNRKYLTPMLVAKKEFYKGVNAVLIFNAYAYHDLAILAILTDDNGVVLAQEASTANEITGYDILGDYVINYHGDQYTITLDITEDEGDMITRSTADFHYRMEMESVSDFIVPATRCPELDITGMWGITLCNKVVHCYDTDIRYELLMSIRKEEDETVTYDLCETLIISDGKHFNKVVPVNFFEDPADEDKLPERGSRKLLFTDFAGMPFLFSIVRTK